MYIYNIIQTKMASQNMYSVAAFIGDEFVFQSDIFSDKSEAKNLMNLLKSSDTGDISFQLYKHFPRGKTHGGYTYQNESIEYNETTCQSMTIYAHDELDNTYILEPCCNSDYYGLSSFLGAKWSSEYLGWILTPSQYKLAVSYGASVSSLSEEDDNSHDYPSMTLYLHDEELDSYILEPPKDSVHYGQHNFFDGYWSEQHKGWIFSSSQADELIELGVTVYQGGDDEEESYEGCTLEYYKKGLLMTCDKSNSLYGEPYLGEGFWNKKLKGWVFKVDQLDTLIEKGAQMEEVDDEVYTFDGFAIQYYKNGLLMTCHESHNLYGEPYLGKGFWNKKLKGWVYKTEYLDDLVANGAKLIKQEEESSSVNFKKMKYYDYGKGHLLVPNKSCEYAGEKYFHDGFWMPKHNGWFFRARFSDFVENCGAKYMGAY